MCSPKEKLGDLKGTALECASLLAPLRRYCATIQGRPQALLLARISVFLNIRLSPFKAYKSRYEEPALKARGSKAQGEGRAAAETLGRDEVHEEPWKGETEACSALSGLILFLILLPRVPEPASRALPPWAVLHRACSAPNIRLSCAYVREKQKSLHILRSV